VTSNEIWRRYLEAGAAVGQLTVARAEDIAKRLFDTDEDERERAWSEVDHLAQFGMRMGEQLVDMARAELSRQLMNRGGDSLDRLFAGIADLLGSESAGRSSQAPEPSEPTGSLGAPIDVEAAVETTKTFEKHETEGSGASWTTEPRPHNNPHKNKDKHNKDKQNKDKQSAKGPKGKQERHQGTGKKHKHKKKEKEPMVAGGAESDGVFAFATPAGPAPSS